MIRTRSLRRGMTLVEITIALVLLGIVSGVIMRVITRQQRFYQGANQIMTQRSQLRQGISVLPVDLRSLSSVGGDLLAVSDSAIEFDVNIGTGVVCEAPGGAGKEIVLPPINLNSGATLTALAPGVTLSAAEILKGINVLIYNDSSTVGNFDDRWMKLRLKDAQLKTDRCVSTPFTSSVLDLGKRRIVLTVEDTTGASDPVTTGPVSQYIAAGAPVRLMKRARYKLFQHTDSKWYLGYSDYDRQHNAYEDLLPVSGPYDAYQSGLGAASGFMFRFYDVDGVEIAPGAVASERARIARIDVVARSRTSGNVRAAGIQAGANQQYRDSLAVSVMLRNRN